MSQKRAPLATGTGLSLPRAMHRASAISTLSALIAALGACGTESLTPDAPRPREGAAAAPALPSMAASIVDAPISYALKPALEALERAVPQTFGSFDKRLTVKSNRRQQVAFEATRTPFDVAFDGRRLTLSTIITYKGRGWYNPFIGPTLSASCGTGSQQPRLRVVMTTDLDITPSWRISSITRVRTVSKYSAEPRDECLVTFFKFNVTDRVVDAVKPQITSRLPALDRRIHRFDVYTRVSRWYGLMQHSIRVRDSLWLNLAPEQVRLGGFALQDSALVATVRLFAHPTLITGPRPRQLIRPLPPFTNAANEVGDSARLRIEGLLSYDLASAALTKELVGRRFRRFGRAVRIDSVRFYPLGDGRIVLALNVAGDVRGTAYLVGTPRLDVGTRALTVPDLDFDVSTDNALVSGLAWLKRADMVAELRQRARFPLDAVLEDTRGKVEEALNRDLTDGVRLSGHVRTGRLLDVLVHPQWLVVRAEAAGTIALDVNREIRITGASPRVAAVIK